MNGPSIHGLVCIWERKLQEPLPLLNSRLHSILYTYIVTVEITSFRLHHCQLCPLAHSNSTIDNDVI